MNIRITILISCAAICLSTLLSCQHKPYPVPSPAEIDSFGNYPPEVGRIIVKKCADGCHEPASAADNASLSLDTWEHMFNGANNGAVVIPYSPEFSSLMYFINTDSSRGSVVAPTMPYNKNPPYNRPPLTDDEYNTIKDWIAKGAPDKDGNIPFASSPATRQKIYMTMQGCNLVGVIDAEKKVIMRYINVKGTVGDYSPHTVRISPDGQYAYVCFSADGQTLVKINTNTDEIEARLPLNFTPAGAGYSWNAFHISPTGDSIAVTNLSSGPAGKIMMVDTKSPQYSYPLAEELQNPHGITSNRSFDTFYVTSQYSNAIYRIWAGGKEAFSIDGNPVKFSLDSSQPAPNPHEILLSPDGSKLFITCQGTDEVRVLDAHTLTLIKTIHVGKHPQEMSISRKMPYLFVSCMYDQNYNGNKFSGSVYIIDYETMNKVGVMEGRFSQPHGVGIDDINNVIYVGNRNVNPGGPAPHHTSNCGGRNGYYQTFDLFTLEPIGIKNEITPDPYGCDVRFK